MLRLRNLVLNRHVLLRSEASVRIVRSFCIALTVCWVLICCGGGIVAIEGALHPGHRPITQAEEVSAISVAERNGAELTHVTVDATDGVHLRAWSIRPRNGSHRTVILLHGQADNRAGMLGNADMLLRNGYAVVLPDARAHGMSGGDVATYGLKEATDLRTWFDWVRRAEGTGCIDALGDSMGAAQLLRSLSSVQDSARWLPNLHSQVFAKHPTSE